ncbi:MAG: hypothetical protein WCX08_02935 [Candidatus Buchananbacteria bacterium]
MKKFKKLSIFILAGLFFITLPVLVFAAKNQPDSVGPDEIIEGNFIKAGENIDLAGAVNGDVMILGNNITISGPVAGDVIILGSNIKIKGDVSGSVRVLGSNIEIDGNVSHNVWALGSSVVLNSDAWVGWDFYSTAADIAIKGAVDRRVAVTGANILIANQVGGDITAALGSDGKLTLAPEASITGNLNYQAVNDQQLILKEGSVVIGKITREARDLSAQSDWQKSFNSAVGLLKIISLFSLLVVGLVLITLIPKPVLEIKEEMLKRIWPSIGWGLVYLIVIPAATILLMMTIIGLPLALIIIPLYLIGLYLSKIIAAFVIGLVILDSLAPGKKHKGSLMWPLVLGLLIFVIVGSIPFLGWLARLALVLWAFGAMIQTKKYLIKTYR